MQTIIKKPSWRPFVKMLKDAKLPWIQYILGSLINLSFTYIFVQLPILAGEIASGEIFDPQKISRYTVLSILSVLSGLFTIYMNYISIKIERRLISTAWKKFIWLPVNVFERLGPSTAVSRVTEDASLAERILSVLFGLLDIIYMVVMTLYALICMNMKLSLIIVPLLVMNSILGIVGSKIVYKINYRIQDSISKMMSFLSERLINMKFVKACGTEESEYDFGTLMTDNMYKAQLGQINWMAFMSVFSSIADILVLVTVFVYGGFMIKNGELQMSELIAFYMFSQIIPNTISGLTVSILELKGLQGSYNCLQCD